MSPKNLTVNYHYGHEALQKLIKDIIEIELKQLEEAIKTDKANIAKMDDDIKDA